MLKKMLWILNFDQANDLRMATHILSIRPLLWEKEKRSMNPPHTLQLKILTDNMIARNFREILSMVGKNQQIERIILRKSADLVCNNLMCEKVTLPCICRFERVLEKVDPAGVLSIDVSGNGLSSLPPSMAKFLDLKELDISNNNITEIPEFYKNLPKIVIINREDSLKGD